MWFKCAVVTGERWYWSSQQQQHWIISFHDVIRHSAPFLQGTTAAADHPDDRR